MSDQADSPDAEPLYSGESVTKLLEDWYHVPVLVAVVAFMIWVRLLSMDRFTKNGRVVFSGNDAWYHLREVSYIVDNWPRIMPFDPWTHFSYGTAAGQFGTLYDQLIATAAIVVGFGSPSDHTVAMTLLVAPVIFGAATAIPTYFVAKRLEGRLAGVFAALVIAFLPGTFLSRSLVGSADHNVAEPLFQTIAVLGTMVALAVVARERPVWEQVRERDFEGLRAPMGWSVLAGVALATYMWVWPPGVLLVGILGVFYVLKFTTDVLRGTSPEHTAFAAATSMGTAALLMFVPFSRVDFVATQFSLLQPAMALTVAGGAIFLAWLARTWERRSYARHLYPVATLGVALIGIAVLAVALPSVFGLIRRNLIRFVGFNAGAQQRTIVEAAPWLSQGRFITQVFAQYGLAMFTALLGAAYLLDDVARSEELTGDRLLILVWFAFILSAAFTQVRFNYYLAVPVAILNGVLFYRTISHSWFGAIGSPDDLNASHLLVALAIVMIVVAPLALGVNQGQRGLSVSSPTFVGANTGPGGFQGWQTSLNWLEENTPAEGTYGGATNGDEMRLYGSYPVTDNFDYPAGAYGVMSWWDYGHWLTVAANRIPNANPFQQGATAAANYLLAPNASDGAEVLAQIDEDDAKTRYVAIDYQMVSTRSKFSAPTIFYDRYDVNAGDFRTPLFTFVQGGQQVRQAAFIKHQRYYESMMVRLYRYHGSFQGPQQIVVDWAQNLTAQGTQFYLGPRGNQSIVRQFPNMTAARQFVRRDGTAQVGGIADLPPRSVPALEHYRMIYASPENGRIRTEMPAYLKLFERVPGAVIHGQGPPNATITAAVNMSVPTRDTSFIYQQRVQTGPDGNFTMTLPYSTFGYENWGPAEGYTNVSVRANGPYRISGPLVIQNGTLKRYQALVRVSEANVIGEVDEPIPVTLKLENASFGIGSRPVPEPAVNPALDPSSASTSTDTVSLQIGLDHPVTVRETPQPR